MGSVANNPRLYFIASLLGNVSLLAPVLSLFYLHRGLVYSDFFIMLIIIVVSMFLFEVPTGAFADKFGPRASLVVGQSLTLTSMLLLLIANSPFVFYFISAITGLAITFASGCDEAFIYDSLKEQKKEKRMSATWGKILSAGHLAAIPGVVVGALIAKDLAESQFIFLISIGIVFALAKLVMLFFLTNPATHYKKVQKPSPFYHVKNGLKQLRKTPALLLLFLNETLVFIPLHVFNNFDQPFFIDNGLPVVFIGIVYAVFQIVAYFVSRNIEYFEKKLSTLTLIHTTGIMILLAYLAAAFVRNIYVAIAVFFLLKLGNVVRYPVFAQIKNEYIPSESRATTLSLLSMIDSFFDVIIFSILATIANLGIPTIFLGSAIIVCIGLLFPVKRRASNSSP